MSLSPVPLPWISAAAIWLSELDASPSPIVPVLRSRFGLSATDACEAIRLAAELRSNRVASERLRKHVGQLVGILEASGATILSIGAEDDGAVIEWHPSGADVGGEPILTRLIRRSSPAGKAQAEAQARHAAYLNEEIPVLLDDEARRLRDLH